MNKNRRDLVKLLSVTGGSASVLPSKWVKPVVDSAILPGHAITSCEAVEGCFEINGGSQHFHWPANTTDANVDVYNASCNHLTPDGTSSTLYLAIATNQGSAEVLLNCEGGETAVQVETNPALNGGCSFWTCSE